MMHAGFLCGFVKERLNAKRKVCRRVTKAAKRSQQTSFEILLPRKERREKGGKKEKKKKIGEKYCIQVKRREKGLCTFSLTMCEWDGGMEYRDWCGLLCSPSLLCAPHVTIIIIISTTYVNPCCLLCFSMQQ
uniref:Uncharacterized protein n=1 Tax=Trypanosoma congolense (strain IL3000) TaxID=1068625 RepID=G0UP83_TRYCI|nr:hypothetical protein, unlikely [Trypanosoma congolense IL3000]